MRRGGQVTADPLFAACLGTLLAQNAVEVKPTHEQTLWQDMAFGVILHFGTNTFLDLEWGDGTASPKIFDPEDFNPNQWRRRSRRPLRSTW